jgi:hypothetical protein
MFKNRAFQVKLVKDKDSKKSIDPTPAPNPIDYEKIGKDVAFGVGALVGGYVVLDTLRQVTILIVKAKL